MLQISTQLIANEAKRRGWGVEPLDEQNLSTLAITPPNGRVYYFESCQPPLQSAAAMVIANNKLATYQIAKRLAIPVAPFIKVDPNNLDLARNFLKKQKQIVVKPIDTNHGKGITVGVQTDEQLQQALEYAKEYSRNILLQACHFGHDCRLLVIDGKFFAAGMRTPAHVIGDGRHTIEQLIKLKNMQPGREHGHTGRFSKIHLQNALRHLGEEQFVLVPANGQKVDVAAVANTSQGGDSHDITGEIHKSFVDSAQKIAQALNMFICGVDFLAKDYTKPFTAENAILLEINATPGLRMHQQPAFGEPRDAAKAILDAFERKIN